MNKNKGIWISILMVMVICGLYAEKSLERIANETGVEAETLYNEGKYVEAAKKFEIAITKLNEAVKKDGIPIDNEKIMNWMKNTFNGYFKGKDYKNALRIQNMRIKHDPDNYKLINYKAIILKKYMNKTSEAIAILKEYNAKKKSFKVVKKIAGYYSDLKDYKNAVEWYEKAYKLKQDSGIIQKIASLYLKLDKKAEAIKAYEDFIKTNPKEKVLAKTYRNMGALYDELKNSAKSIEYYEKSLTLKYDNNIALVLITKYYDNDVYDKALKKIELLLKNKSGNNEAIYFRAMIKYNRGKNAEAKTDFKKLLNDPKYSKIAKGFIESIESE